MHKIDELLEKAKPWLQQCGNCDAGLALNCVCPTGDPRQLISDLVNEVAIYAALVRNVRPLSDLDSALRHAEVEAQMGDESCGGSAAYSGPCGGCASCYHGMVSHGFEQERREARLYHDAGLEWAPHAIDAYAITGGYSASFAPRHSIDHLTTWNNDCNPPKEKK